MPAILFRTRIVWVAVAAAVCGLLTAAPSVYMIVLVDRALPAHSIEAVVTWGLVAGLLVLVGGYLGNAAQALLKALWVATGIRDQPAEAAIRSGITWAGLSSIPIPLLLGFVAAIHPLIALSLLVSILASEGARRLTLTATAQTIVAASSVVAASITCLLVIEGDVGLGALFGVSLLAGRIVAPACVVLANAGAILHSLRRLVAAGAASESADATAAHAAVTAGVGCVAAIALAACWVPAPNVVVMAGVVAPGVHAASVKAATVAPVDVVYIRDGDRVQAGEPLITFDVSEYKAQRTVVQQQIELERSALVRLSGDIEGLRTKREAQLASMRDLFGRGLRPAADLVDLELQTQSEAMEAAERQHARQSLILRLQERLSDIERAIAAGIIRAPVDGIVQQLQAPPRGLRVQPGDPLFVLVPEAIPVVHATLSPADRTHVKERSVAEVRLRLSRFRYGEPVAATISTISADRTADNVFRVTLDPRAHLPPGTDVEVYVREGSQSAAGWISAVISGGMRRAIQ